MPSARRACPTNGSATTRCGFSCTRSPKINEVTFLHWIELPAAMAGSSMTRIQLKLIKIGARVVHHARGIIYQLAEVAVTGAMVRAIRRLRAPQLFT